jgi:hypothetical protein
MSGRDYQGLWRVCRDGSGLTRLTDQRVEDFALSGDGALVAYVVGNAAGPPSYELWLIELASGTRRLLSDDAWSPSWHDGAVWYVGDHQPHPTSGSSAYGFGQAIFRIAIPRGEDPTRVADAPGPEERILRARISPDGERLWVIVRTEARPRSLRWLWILDTDERKWRDIGESVSCAVWSEDGSRLAWSAGDVPSEGRLFVAQLR